MKIAYLVSRFPKISETFVLREILEIMKLDCEIRVFPLVREAEGVSHEEVSDIEDRVQYNCRIADAAAAHAHWIRTRPAVYFGTWGKILAGHLRSPPFLARSVAVMIKSVFWARKLEEWKADCIHAHWATHPALGAYIINRLTGIPYGFTAHAHDIYVARPMLAEKIRNAGYVCAISEYNKSLLCSLYGRDLTRGVSVVRLGVDTKVFAPPQKRPERPPFRIICVAGIEDYKGYPELIKALSFMKDNGRHFVCHCIGEGKLRGMVDKLIKQYGLEKEVVLLGRRTWRCVHEYMSKAHCAVLASTIPKSGRHEGIPVAMMEALAMGLPAVATRISGVPELIEDGKTGLLAEAGDPGGLARALERIYDDPGLSDRLASAGRERVVREYDLALNAAMLHRLQRHCAGNNTTIADA